MRPIDNQVEEYLNYCRYNRNMTGDTMGSKEWILRTFAKQCGVEDMQVLSNRHINAWVQLLAKRNIAGRTINTRLSHVIALAKWLRDMDYDIKLKLAMIDKVEEEPPRRNYFTRAQIEAAKEHCNPMERLLVSLAFDSGLRLTELTYLRLENIDGRKLKIKGKGRKVRVTYMTEETYDMLMRWVARRNIIDYLWVSPLKQNGSPYSTDQIRYIMKRPFKRAGLEGFYPHAVRHSFATDMEINKAPIPVIQKLMGHSSSAITERYLHGLDTNLLDMYDEFKAPQSITNI